MAPIALSNLSLVCCIARPASGVVRFSHSSAFTGRNAPMIVRNDHERDDEGDGSGCAANYRAHTQGEEREHGEEQRRADDRPEHRGSASDGSGYAGRLEAVAALDRAGEDERGERGDQPDREHDQAEHDRLRREHAAAAGADGERRPDHALGVLGRHEHHAEDDDRDHCDEDPGKAVPDDVVVAPRREGPDVPRTRSP